MGSIIQFPNRDKLQTYLENHPILECDTTPKKKEIIEQVSIIFAKSKRKRDIILPRVLLSLYVFKKDLPDEKVVQVAKLLTVALINCATSPRAKL